MPASATWSQAERSALQTKLTVTTPQSLYDLSKSLYGGKVSTTDAVRSYLQTALSVTNVQPINDLWRLYFVSKGVANQTSLGDMARTFYGTIGF